VNEKPRQFPGGVHRKENRRPLMGNAAVILRPLSTPGKRHASARTRSAHS
jgi:hypothetical protein